MIKDNNYLNYLTYIFKCEKKIFSNIILIMQNENNVDNLTFQERKMFMNESLDYMKNVQDKMMDTYGFSKETNRYIFFPERNRFYMYDQKTKNVFFEARFQVIGTYSKQSATWRWGWSNRYVPTELKKNSFKIKEFGEVTGLKILTKPKVKGENLGFLFTSIGMYLSKAKGYYIIPGGYGYPDIFIVFTKISNVDKKYNEIMKNNRNNKKKTVKKYERIIERSQKSHNKKSKKSNKKDKKLNKKDKKSNKDKKKSKNNKSNKDKKSKNNKTKKMIKKVIRKPTDKKSSRKYKKISILQNVSSKLKGIFKKKRVNKK